MARGSEYEEIKLIYNKIKKADTLLEKLYFVNLLKSKAVKENIVTSHTALRYLRKFEDDDRMRKMQTIRPDRK